MSERSANRYLDRAEEAGFDTRKKEGQAVRGSVRKIGASWTVTLDIGVDPATGKRRQRKKRGFTTRKAADRLAR